VHKHWSADEDEEEALHKSLKDKLSIEDVPNNSFALNDVNEYNESNELSEDARQELKSPTKINTFSIFKPFFV
jgi:uncharacterized protein HemY